MNLSLLVALFFLAKSVWRCFWGMDQETCLVVKFQYVQETWLEYLHLGWVKKVR